MTCLHGLPFIQQARRWMKAGCFEAMAHDLRTILRRQSRGKGQAQPTAAVMDGRTLQSSCESGPRAALRRLQAAQKVQRCMQRWTPWGICSR